MEGVEQTWYEGGSLAVGEWDEDRSLGEAVDESQGFGFTVTARLWPWKSME